MRTFFSMHYLALIFSILLNSSCKKEVPKGHQISYITDREGNQYKTVKIGNLWWMAENLKVRVYRNGKPITEITADTGLWQNNTSGAYSKSSYGLLYNWYAVSNSKKLAPVGWHVATDQDWKELEMELGMSTYDADRVNWRGTNQGDKLKTEGVQDWVVHDNIWGTNESDFYALPASCRMFDDRSTNPLGDGYMAFWWTSSSESNTGHAWYRHLDYKKSNVFRYYGPKTYGFSVRCVKD
jgi:uncharacterized protein (TIGR02145 family)